MVRYGRVDGNQSKCTDAARDFAAQGGYNISLINTKTQGFGFPDIVVGYRYIIELWEIKLPKGTLRKTQKQFIENWMGRPIKVIRTTKDVVKALQAIDKELDE